METKAVLGFAIILALLALGLVGMFVLGRPSRRRRRPSDVGQVGDGAAWGGDGGSGADFVGHSGGHADGGGHGGH